MSDASLDSRIRERASTFSRGFRRVAEYVTDQQNAAGLLTASSLADNVGVSEATVVRFAQTLGYSGYPDMRRALQVMLKNEVTTVSRFASTVGSTAGDSILRSYLTDDAEALHRSVSTVAADQFDSAVQLLTDARRVYTVGNLMSFPAAQLLRSGLRMIGIDARTIEGPGSDASLDLHDGDERDVVVSVALRRYNAQTVAAVDLAQEMKMGRIAITDDVLSPTATRSDLALVVATNRSEFFQSTTTVTSVVNALVTACSLVRPDRSESELSALERHWTRARVFHQE
ncbi:MurR/RpiR family transcriptional regulator [Rhodococcoides yunnanense]|uniref:MurR/RpiR family transcriptional regulator n=1 Tax=Rhodococcoides yunnanense TaxID=278209 RepID=UPI00093527D6|nr:MurR/RpiR family transcriptional regulator [Rhodococcus yunnanensis]